MSDIAQQLVDALTARGIGLIARGKKLEVVPKSAYATLSNDERATIKAHKAAIVAIVREGTYAKNSNPITVLPAPPTPCEFCYRTPCIGEAHPAYETLHPLTERQLYERGKAQLMKDLDERRMRVRLGLPPYAMWGDV